MNEQINNKYPAFMFYPMDFLTDSKVVAMPSDARGIYITLLCLDWINDGIEGDWSDILVMAGHDFHDFSPLTDSNQMTKPRHLTLIPLLKKCFIDHPEKPGTFTNPRLYRYRCELKAKHNNRIQSGKKGGLAKAKQSSSKALAKAKQSPSKALANSSHSVSYSYSYSNSKDIKNTCSFFEEDWKKYPKKGNKKKAFGYYQKTVTTPEKRVEFLNMMESYIASVDNPKYYKNGDTFFNQWQDLEVGLQLKEKNERLGDLPKMLLDQERIKKNEHKYIHEGHNTFSDEQADIKSDRS